MASNERNIIVGVVAVVLLLGFWLMILGPKRNKASELGQQVSDLKEQVATAQQEADFAQQARKSFPVSYGKLVVLGKAVPEDSDSASFLVQLNHIAKDSHVDFRALELSDDAAGAAAAPPPQPGLQNAPPSTSQPSTDQPGAAPTAAGASGETAQPSATSTTSGTTASSTGAQPAATTAPATEASASTTAIGAGIGPAGLSTLKYNLKFSGSFFDIADFVKGVDKLVSNSNGKTVVDGRLTTIDGFALTADPRNGFPSLQASFTVTTYLTPPAQGLTGGAAPTGPAPTTPGQTTLQPASSTGATP